MYQGFDRGNSLYQKLWTRLDKREKRDLRSTKFFASLFMLFLLFASKEASYFDQIIMTKHWLEYDRKISQRQNIFFELDRNSWHRQTLTLPQKICWCCRLGHLPSLASLLYKKKTSGIEVRRTPDVKLRFVGFTRFVSFNFGHIQKVMFVVVKNLVKFKK